jgi:tRNA (cytosine38-C5)-methyltransferase
LQTTTVFDHFLAAKDAGERDAVRILDPLRLRYLSPSELLRLFCFIDRDDDGAGFAWPEGLSNKVKYRLLGNSVNVSVVAELLRYLLA